MATSEPAQVSALEKIKQDFLECSICKEEYTEPKLLDCLHSFCKHCLLEYHTANNRDAKMLICPLCQQETQLPEKGVQDLKTNLILTGLALQLEQISSSEYTKLFCKLCEDGNEATLCCFDCPMVICAECNKMHLKIPALSNHTVATFQDILDGKVPRKEQRRKHLPECQTHEDKVLRFYCTTCDVMICRDCTIIDHCKPPHEYIDCSQASATCKQSLTQLTTPLKETLKKLQQSQATVSIIKDNLDNTVKRTMAEVNKRVDEIRAAVTAQESRIMDEIRNIQTSRKKKMEEYEQIVHKNYQQIQQSVQKAKDVSNKSAPEFLAVHPTISKDLKSLRDQNQPKIDPTLAHVRFELGVCGISLGNLMEPDEGFRRARDIDASVPGDEVAVEDTVVMEK